jgi:hypothetical protein
MLNPLVAAGWGSAQAAYSLTRCEPRPGVRDGLVCPERGRVSCYARGRLRRAPPRLTSGCSIAASCARVPRRTCVSVVSLRESSRRAPPVSHAGVRLQASGPVFTNSVGGRRGYPRRRFKANDQGDPATSPRSGPSRALGLRPSERSAEEGSLAFPPAEISESSMHSLAASYHSRLS